MTVRVFIAGIMQGSRTEKNLHSQDYRTELAELFQRRMPELSVYDPFAKNQDSINYGNEKGLETFLRHNEMCGTEIDLLIAYLPEASMGTAIEMWEARKNGAVIVSISAMTRNWVVRYLSHRIYPDLETFKGAVGKGEITALLAEYGKISE
jgi:hypothetical protein